MKDTQILMVPDITVVTNIPAPEIIELIHIVFTSTTINTINVIAIIVNV